MSQPLIVTPPLPGMIRIRFVATKGDWLSSLIEWREMGSVSHCEAVLPSGEIIAALIGEGVVRKPADYDKTSTSQIFVDIEPPPGGLDRWTCYLESRLNRPYDMDAILGFVLHTDRRKRGGMICSMLMALSLAHNEAGVFPRPLSERAHKISPRDLLLILSAHPAATIGQLESLTP
jgi:hypothetical protein